MEIDQNDQNPTNSIIKLSKAFDDVHASKSDPDRPFPSHLTCLVHTEQQTDERTTRIDKKLMEIDQNDQNPSNSIIQLRNAQTNFREDTMKIQVLDPPARQTLMTNLCLQDLCMTTSTLTKLATAPPCFLGHGAQ